MTGVSTGTGTARQPQSRVPPAERGATRVADRVVEKIAAQAAREAVGPPPADGDAPHATVAVRHGTARVHIELDLGYPCDIGARCAAVRRRVTERVGALANLTVSEVAVWVERLYPSPKGAERTR
ncbi:MULTISPECIES: Asp23/Gls24 family envelope stress response protein [Streptomyces]|uniref:Asp23/Gls24 family envelope stress response protein n=1 Tax=Streptomyces misionensis TaxID=67331 RepID=A0A1H4TFQ7_9ACTN|nr:MULTISPECIES: Asp23/Gls24 family envelope stress response protein [Streptomyces]SEC54981.1 hypothetical protein SAMN04490357_2275 [Streptomyces misionensis]SFY52538.1 hypothetical protein STEPF1_05811 [Streptomyces sp. F-1]